jgi:hypothetical protein
VPPPPETCPNCGVNVPRNARACPECGADEQTGWSEDAYAQRLDLPDDNFNYDEFVKEEFGPHKNVRPRGVSWFWWLVALGLALLMLWPLLRSLR